MKCRPEVHELDITTYISEFIILSSVTLKKKKFILIENYEFNKHIRKHMLLELNIFKLIEIQFSVTRSN